jgi:hypothetical protein
MNCFTNCVAEVLADFTSVDPDRPFVTLDCRGGGNGGINGECPVCLGERVHFIVADGPLIKSSGAVLFPLVGFNMPKLRGDRKHFPEGMNGRKHIEMIIGRLGWIFPLDRLLAGRQIAARYDQMAVVNTVYLAEHLGYK